MLYLICKDIMKRKSQMPKYEPVILGTIFYGWNNCPEEIRKYKVVNITSDYDIEVEDQKTGYRFWWLKETEIYDLDTVYHLQKNGFNTEIDLAKMQIKHAKQKLKEIEEYYKKEKENA